MFSQNYACPEHNISIEELNPRMFSFNNPFGACEKCTGLGTFMSIDPDLVIPDKNKSIREGAIRASGWYYVEGGLAEHVLPQPGRPLPLFAGHPHQGPAQGNCGHPALRQQGREDQDGAGHRRCQVGTYYTEFEGVANNLERRFRETSSNWMREEITTWMNCGQLPRVPRRPSEKGKPVGD